MKQSGLEKRQNSLHRYVKRKVSCPNSFVTEVRCMAERELMHCELREMISLRDRVGWNRTQDFE